MPSLAEIEGLLNSTEIDKRHFTEVGAAALWEVSFYQDPEDPSKSLALLDPAAELLSKVVRTELSVTGLRHSRSYLLARNHLAHKDIHRSIGEGEEITQPQVQAVHREVADILGQLDLRTPKPEVSRQITDLTYQLLLSRLQDPRHLALPAPPFATKNKNWGYPTGYEYPDTSLFVLASDGRPIPSVIMAAFYDGYKGHIVYPLANIINLGNTLAYALKLQNPKLYSEALPGGHMQRQVQAVRYAAKLILQEASGQNIGDDLKIYLTNQGKRLAGFADTKSKQVAMLEAANRES